MSEQPPNDPKNQELTDEQLDEVSGGIIIVGGRFALPAVQKHVSSVFLGGPDTLPGGNQL